MRKKIFTVFLAVLVLAFASVPAFAADGSSRGVLSWFSDVGGFIRDIFVPDGNYFNNQLSLLNDHINSRFAGLGELYQMLDNFFKTLRNPPPISLSLTIPTNFLFPGYRGTRVDFLTSAKPYFNLMRDILNAAVCLLTAIVCYHKLRTFFTEEG